MTSTTMQDWNIDGNKVGSYYMTTVLNKVSQLQDIRTVEGTFVRRWDKKTLVNGTKIGSLFYAKSVMLATGHAERMTRAQQRHWLKRLNNTIAPSLQHVPYGKKASSMSVLVCFAVNSCIMCANIVAVQGKTVKLISGGDTIKVLAEQKKMETLQKKKIEEKAVSMKAGAVKSAEAVVGGAVEIAPVPGVPNDAVGGRGVANGTNPS